VTTFHQVHNHTVDIAAAAEPEVADVDAITGDIVGKIKEWGALGLPIDTIINSTRTLLVKAALTNDAIKKVNLFPARADIHASVC
jgi:hypothetical protein